MCSLNRLLRGEEWTDEEDKMKGEIKEEGERKKLAQNV